MACSSCRSSSCSGCSTCSSTPFYQQAEACVEDHCEKIYQAQYAFSLCPTSSWNVPLCGQTAILEVEGIIGVTVGAYLWHPEYGYFLINSVNTTDGTIGITNTCPNSVEYQAAPGTQIPECTCFVVTTPPVSTENENQCVSVGFTAPAEGDTIDITLTSSTGLAVGDIIQIGSGFYYVAEVKPDNIISITNQGEGITPGTPVIPTDANGNFLYCLTIVSTTPCTRPEVDEGFILACDGEDTVAPLNPDTFEGFNSDAISATLTFVSPTLTGTTAPATLTLTNISPTRPMTVMVHWLMNTSYNAQGPLLTGYNIEASVNGGAYASILLLSLAEVIPNEGSSVAGFKQIVKTTTHSVAASTTLTLAGRATVLFFGAGTVATCSLNLEMTSINISI